MMDEKIPLLFVSQRDDFHGLDWGYDMTLYIKWPGY
jgi:hypothetical protein